MIADEPKPQTKDLRDQLAELRREVHVTSDTSEDEDEERRASHLRASAAGVAAAEEGALISFIADVAAGRKGRPQGTTAAHKALEVETARLRQDHMKHRKDMLESLGLPSAGTQNDGASLTEAMGSSASARSQGGAAADPGSKLTVGNIMALMDQVRAAAGPNAEFWPSDSDDGDSAKSGAAAPKAPQAGSQKERNIMRFIDQAETALPAHEVEEEMMTALRERESQAARPQEVAEARTGAGVGASRIKMRHRRHMWVQTEESALHEVQELQGQVAALREELNAVRHKVASVQAGVVLEHHQRMTRTVEKERETMRRGHEQEVKELRRRLVQQEAAEEIRVQHELAALRAELERESTDRVERTGTLLRQQIVELRQARRELRTALHGKDHEVLMLTTQNKQLEAEVARLTQELSDRKYAETIEALNEELTQERQTREGVEKALTKKTQEMMALEAIRKSLQQQLDRMAADKAAALSKAAAKIKNLEAEHERKTEMAEMHLRERDRELEAVTRHRDRLQGDYDRQVQVNELLNQRFQATVKRMNQEAAALKHTMTRHKEAFKAKLDAMKRAMQSGRGDPDAASMRSGWMSNLGSLLEDGRSLSMIRSRGRRSTHSSRRGSPDGSEDEDARPMSSAKSIRSMKSMKSVKSMKSTKSIRTSRKPRGDTEGEPRRGVSAKEGGAEAGDEGAGEGGGATAKAPPGNAEGGVSWGATAMQIIKARGPEVSVPTSPIGGAGAGVRIDLDGGAEGGRGGGVGAGGRQMGAALAGFRPEGSGEGSGSDGEGEDEDDEEESGGKTALRRASDMGSEDSRARDFPELVGAHADISRHKKRHRRAMEDAKRPELSAMDKRVLGRHRLSPAEFLTMYGAKPSDVRGMTNADLMAQVEDRLRGVVAVQGFMEMYTAKLESEIVDAHIPKPMQPMPRGGASEARVAGPAGQRGGVTRGRPKPLGGALTDADAAGATGTLLGFGSSVGRETGAGRTGVSVRGPQGRFLTDEEWASELFLGRNKPRKPQLDPIDKVLLARGKGRATGAVPKGLSQVGLLTRQEILSLNPGVVGEEPKNIFDAVPDTDLDWKDESQLADDSQGPVDLLDNL